MPVVSDPCSCQSDCLVCGRGERPPMIVPSTFCWNRWCFRERMLHGEPTEENWEEILKMEENIYPLPCLRRTKIAYVGDNIQLCQKWFSPTPGNSSRNSHHVVQNSLPHQHYPLAAMVGKDGKLYFRLVDVGSYSVVPKYTKICQTIPTTSSFKTKMYLPAHKQYPS
ncbi:uncharacterized protein TNCV_3651151 [Trichonephila clavipes]|nr:uncharacterized protein TNCV_3651151 [Trichonephila clavipes]